MHNTRHSHDIIKSNQRHQKLRRSADEWRSIITDYKTTTAMYAPRGKMFFAQSKWRSHGEEHIRSCPRSRPLA